MMQCLYESRPSENLNWGFQTAFCLDGMRQRPVLWFVQHHHMPFGIKLRHMECVDLHHLGKLG